MCNFVILMRKLEQVKTLNRSFRKCNHSKNTPNAAHFTGSIDLCPFLYGRCSVALATYVKHDACSKLGNWMASSDA